MIFKKRIEHCGEPAAVNPRKWLPRINYDYCQGCGRCIAACPAQCLALVWSYSTLVRPADCTSCAACATICPEHLIVMAWETADGSRDIGRWSTCPLSGHSAEGGTLALVTSEEIHS